MKRDDTTADLVAMLVLWWRVERARDLAALDYPHECPSCIGYRTSRQYDDQNSAMETDMRGQVARQIGYIVDSMPEPYRTALYILARNRATGVQVWTSARLPEDADERAGIVASAVQMFGDRV